MFDINSIHTRSNALCWGRDLLRTAYGAPIIIVANKLDLIEQEPSSEDNQVVSKYIKISVNNKDNILNPLETITELLLLRQPNLIENHAEYAKD